MRDRVAKTGDRAALNLLLSRPLLSPAAEPFWDAFIWIERDRDTFSHALGMAGGVLLSARIKRREIRAEGYRRGYRGGELDEFVLIVAAWDDERVNLSNGQTVAEFRAALARNAKRSR